MTDEELGKIAKLVTSVRAPWWQKNLSVIITIIMIVGGGVAAYAKSEADVEFLQKQMAAIEQTQEKHSTEIEHIKLKAVVNVSDLKHIKEKVDNMDKKLDKLLEAR